MESERGLPHPEAETGEIKWIYLTESIIEKELLDYKAGLQVGFHDPGAHDLMSMSPAVTFPYDAIPLARR